MLTTLTVRFWAFWMMMGVITVFLTRSPLAMQFVIRCLARCCVILDENHRHVEAIENLEAFEESSKRASNNHPMADLLTSDLEKEILARARPDSVIAQYIRG